MILPDMSILRKTTAITQIPVIYANKRFYAPCYILRKKNWILRRYLTYFNAPLGLFRRLRAILACAGLTGYRRLLAP